MNFFEAIEILKSGKSIRAKGKNVDKNPIIRKRDIEDGKWSKVYITLASIIADWEIVEDGEC